MDSKSLVIAFALVALPGLGATLTNFRPREASFPLQLAGVFGAGYAITGLLSTILVLLHVLALWTFLVAWVLITAGLWYFGLRRAGPSARLRALVDDFRANAWSMGAGLVLLVVFTFLLSDYSPLINFGKSNPFRYWADGVEIATEGHLPNVSLQWGASYPATISKLIFNSFDAGVSLVIPEHLAAMGAVTMIYLIGVPVALWAVATEMGLRYGAPVVLALTMGPLLANWMAFNPSVFSGEGFGLMVSLSALAFSIHALRRRGWRGAVLPGVVFGAALGIHMVPTLVMIVVFVWFVVGRAVSGERLRDLLVTSVTIMGIAAGIAGSSLILSRGDIGWQATNRNNTYDTRGDRFDPTLYLATGAARQPPRLQPAIRSERNGGWYDPPSAVFDIYAHRAAGFLPVDVPGFAVPIVLTVVAVAMLLRLPARRPVVVTALGLWWTLLVFGLVFSYMYETYLPASFPERRLFGYGSLALVLVGIVLLETILLSLDRKRAWAGGAATVAVVGIAMVMILPSAEAVSSPGIVPERGAIPVMNRIRKIVPCDARILASERTGGVFQLLSGRAAVTEGLMPFLRPAVSRPVVKLLLGARRFFVDPSRHKRFLVVHGIDYVAVAKEDAIFDPRPPLLGEVDPELLSDVPFLEPAHLGELVDLYRVEGLNNRGADQPVASDFAGYTCGRSELPEA